MSIIEIPCFLYIFAGFVRLKSIRKAQYKLSRKKTEGDDRPVVRNEKISGEDVSLNVNGGVGIDEELVPVSSSSESAFSFEQPQEWITDVPEVAEEISIGLTTATEPIFGEELIEEIPPPSPPQVEAEAEVVEPEPSSSSPPAPEDDVLTPTTTLLPLPPNPPPPPIVKAKPLPGVPKRVDIPFDFYFHNKSDHRHLCPFCTETGSTLTNIRFHVIRLHPEKLFAPARVRGYPHKNFRKVCDSALAAITKEAETGERNPTGTKQIVSCIYCPGSPKTYNDKRAFLCHMILNHYPVIRRKILKIQKDEGYEPQPEPEKITEPVTTTPSTAIVPTSDPTAVVTSPSPPTVTNGTPPEEKKNASSKKPKKRPSGDSKSVSPKTPKKKKSEAASSSTTATPTETAKVKAKIKAEKKKEKEDVFTIPGKYDCDLCGKHLSSSTSRWRHKARYCNVAKDLRDQHLFAELDQEDDETTANHSLSLDGSSADVSLDSGKYLGMDEMSGVGGGIDDHDHLNSTSHHEKIEMEMMMMFQDTNEDFMKLHGSGEIDDDEDGNEQFLSDFQEFYDENEVNDVLLTMTMDGAHTTEDPLHI